MLKNLLSRKKILILLPGFLFVIASFLIAAYQLQNKLLSAYKERESVIITDRKGQVIKIQPNNQGYYAQYIAEVPPAFEKFLIKREDRFFYYHFGINPVSTTRALSNLIINKSNTASSTITQQLAKILLGTEQKRNIKNKMREAIYAISLETYLSKEQILTMYVNSVYFGNNIQGLSLASRLYFDQSPATLATEQILQLLAAIASPSQNHPFSGDNPLLAKNLANKFRVSGAKINALSESEKLKLKTNFERFLTGDSFFELTSLGLQCRQNCGLTIDQELAQKTRIALQKNILSLADKDVINGAVVIIKLPENELLAVIGSPDPQISAYGYQINMAIQPRPIGSTVKPFIYLEGFSRGLRPYTLVEDREYKYIIGTGFPLYPRNYDYQYHGTVNLHYALTNSLNVPAVKVLEYAGLNDFYDFLLSDLQFKPVQDLENYQLGIALGSLEMDLLSLSYYATLFGNQGNLKPLQICAPASQHLCQTDSRLSLNKKIAAEPHVQLVNKVLSDRLTGIEQFGLRGNLNLGQTNYAVKTGTSRDYHDSWTVGYTPDFLAGAWLGNSENTPMQDVAGSQGAAKVWHEIMNILINSSYNHNTPFNFDRIKEFTESRSIEYGLPEDDYQKHRRLLESNELILYPHNYDIFLWEKTTRIPLRARQEVEWYVNDALKGRGLEITFTPEKIGPYHIIAKTTKNTEEAITLLITEDKE